MSVLPIIHRSANVFEVKYFNRKKMSYSYKFFEPHKKDTCFVVSELCGNHERYPVIKICKPNIIIYPVDAAPL